MKYFIDTEFIEGFNKPLFGKRRHFIDLISIGVHREDGKSLHLLSRDWNFKDADEWVKDNVIIPLYRQYVSGDCRNITQGDSFHKLLGFKNEQIKDKLLEFFGCWRDQYFWRAPEDIEVYGYYCDYDWVLLCSLFGRMIDLPKGFPMYCHDLKQTLDEKCAILNETPLTIKELNGYPKQSNEHNALSDAKWNFELYKFLQTINTVNP